MADLHYTDAEAKQIFEEASDAYASGRYSDAIERYERLLAHGRGGPDVLFNLGTTQLASGDLGRGTLNLERAHRFGRGSEDLEANLALARGRQLDKVVGVSAERPFVERVVEATDANVASLAFLVTWGLAFALLAGRRLIPWLRTAGLSALTILLLVLSLPLGAVTFAHPYFEGRHVEAVVISPVLKVRELPREGAKVGFEVHAGLKLRLMEEQGGYVKVRLSNGLEGWLTAAGVERI